MENEIFLYPPPEYVPLAKDFFSFYKCQNILTFPNDHSPILKQKKDRVCKFCGLNSSQTTFKKKPHIVPYFLGNKYGISDFECDTCNELFCVYESHLAYYLGLNQTFSGSVSRSGIPTLKSSKKDLEVRSMKLFGVDGIMIQKTSIDCNAIDWSEDDLISITFSKGSYKPAYIFKIFLKIALCSLPEDEIQNYKAALNYLKNENNDISGMANVGIYEFNMGFSHPVPFGYLFKKKLKSDRIPTHQFAFYFQNRIITFCLPYNIEDYKSGLYDEKQIDIFVAPPLATIPFKENIPNIFSNADLSSTELLKGEQQTITFRVNPEQIKNAVSLDPKTGELSNDKTIDRQDQKGIFLVPKGTIIKPEAFKQYMKNPLA